MTGSSWRCRRITGKRLTYEHLTGKDREAGHDDSVKRHNRGKRKAG